MGFPYFSPQPLGSAFTTLTCNRSVSKKIGVSYKYLQCIVYIMGYMMLEMSEMSSQVLRYTRRRVGGGIAQLYSLDVRELRK
jgi:hypothetical protein